LVRAGSREEKFEELGPVIEGRGTCLSVSARHLHLALCLSLCRSFSFSLSALVILHVPVVARVKKERGRKNPNGQTQKKQADWPRLGKPRLLHARLEKTCRKTRLDCCTNGRPSNSILTVPNQQIHEILTSCYFYTKCDE
jgi:hypothetical protein